MSLYSQEFSLFVPIVGIADLQYYKTDYHGTIGWDDLGYRREADGHIQENSRTQRRLLKWSALHQIPEMKVVKLSLLFTAENDERVGPHQTYLMTLALQKKFPGSPIYMYEEAAGGHNSRSELVDEATFIATQFHLAEFKPLKDGP